MARQAPPPQGGFYPPSMEGPRLEPVRDPAAAYQYIEVSQALDEVERMTTKQNVRTYNLFAIIEDVTPPTKTKGTGTRGPGAWHRACCLSGVLCWHGAC